MTVNRPGAHIEYEKKIEVDRYEIASRIIDKAVSPKSCKEARQLLSLKYSLEDLKKLERFVDTLAIEPLNGYKVTN